MINRRYCIILLLTMLAEPVVSQTIQSESSPSEGFVLTTLSSVIQYKWEGRSPWEIRRQAIRIDGETLTTITTTPKKIKINIFDGEVLGCSLERIVVDINGVLSLSGTIDNTQYGYFHLSFDGKITLATFEVIEREKKYTITYDRNTNQHFLNEINLLLVPVWKCKIPSTIQR